LPRISRPSLGMQRMYYPEGSAFEAVPTSNFFPRPLAIFLRIGPGCSLIPFTGCLCIVDDRVRSIRVDLPIYELSLSEFALDLVVSGGFDREEVPIEFVDGSGFFFHYQFSSNY